MAKKREGEVVLEGTEAGDSAFVIKSGCLSLVKSQYSEMHILKEGQFTGLDLMISSKGRQATCTATETSRSSSLNHDAISAVSQFACDNKEA